jgi:hypothetical protein
MTGSTQGKPLDRPLLVRVAIPHFCRIAESDGEGYGSSRGDASIFRAVALSRCLGSVLSLARGADEEILGIAEANVLQAPRVEASAHQAPGLVIDCHVFVCGDEFLADALKAFDKRITVHYLSLKDPRRLPFVVRDFLVNDQAAGDADLSLYLEDDLVIQDRLYLDKILWFLRKTEHQYALMPHRYELTGYHLAPRLFVDGPIDPGVLPDHQRPAKNVASGCFSGAERICFDVASNPHSGSFSCSALQRRQILAAGMAEEGFVGPLETVATFTVLQHLQVMKPSWNQRDFLLLEHAHPSFLAARARWER